MKVKDLIEQLKYYKPDDELLVAYWDKEFAETAFDSDDNVTISDELWAQAVSNATNTDYWQNCGSDEICDQVKQLVKKEVA